MLTLRSPAKINLFLRIVRKREDGYHELASLFQAIDLCDALHMQLAEQDLLTCTDPTLPVDEKNLVLKAVNLFRNKTGLKFGVNARLEKRIPHQAGLGGGSGNAATTLWALNKLLGYPANYADLCAWSGEIGSDITFFLSTGTAYCTGRGEVLRSVGSLPQQDVWIVKPEQGTSTPAVYGKLDAAALPRRDPEATLQGFLQGDPDYYNDLETPAFAVLPELAAIKERLLKHECETVLLSGSGSSFFCLGAVPPPSIPGCQIFRTRFINRLDGSWYV